MSDQAYGASAGTSYVLFDEVRVPVGNLLGAENEGFQCIMLNFSLPVGSSRLLAFSLTSTCHEPNYARCFHTKYFAED